MHGRFFSPFIQKSFGLIISEFLYIKCLIWGIASPILGLVVLIWTILGLLVLIWINLF